MTEGQLLEGFDHTGEQGGWFQYSMDLKKKGIPGSKPQGKDNIALLKQKQKPEWHDQKE